MGNMDYGDAPDVKERCEKIVSALDMNHVDLSRVAFMRSKGTSTRNTVARCHGLSRVMQIGMNIKAFYVIEVITELFDRLDHEEQTKVLIHELMHIPRNFGGGFRHHDYVCRKEVDKMYRIFKERTNSPIESKWFKF